MNIGRGFTFVEVIMALLVSSLSLTLLMTTQGTLVKQSGRALFLWHTIIVAKNGFYQKRQEVQAHGADAALKGKSSTTVDDRVIVFNSQPLSNQLLIRGKEKEAEQLIYALFLDRIKVEGDFFGRMYTTTLPLVIAQEKEQPKEEKKGKTA